MLGAKDMAVGTILVVGGTSAFMRWVLTVGAVAGAIREMTSLMTFLVTVVTDNGTRGWIWGR